MSLPLRGAWIEIQRPLIYTRFPFCRSPCGERGLKLLPLPIPIPVGESLPLRGAWIEILKTMIFTLLPSVAPPAGSVD